MNKYRTARLVSDELVVTEAEINKSSIDMIPAFAEGIAKLKANNAQIRATMALQEQSNEGLTTEKGNAQEHLVEWTIDVAGGVHSYAVAKGDNVLKAKVTFTNTEIEHMGFSQLINTANSVLELARGIAVDDLAHYGISAAEISEFEKGLTAFTSVKSSPREAKIEHSGYTDTIAKLQADSQVLLNMMDKLASQFIRKAPTFYAIYPTSRKNRGASHRKKSDTSGTSTIA